MLLRPPTATRPYTLFPCTPLFLPQGLLLPCPREGNRPPLRPHRTLDHRHHLAVRRRPVRGALFRRRRGRGGGNPRSCAAAVRARRLAVVRRGQARRLDGLASRIGDRKSVV